MSFQKELGKHSNQLYTMLGIIGFGTSLVLAIERTPKAIQRIEKKKEELNVDRLTPKETVQTVWKDYIPVALTFGLSVGCVMEGQKISMTRASAAAMMCNLVEETHKEFKEKVVEKIGEDKVSEIEHEIREEKAARSYPTMKNHIINTGNGDDLCYDETFDRWFYSSANAIDAAINNVNKRMIDEMYVSLNDFYDELGLPTMGIGDTIGWNLDRTGFIGRDEWGSTNLNGKPAIVLYYLVQPIDGFYKIY